MMWSIAPQLCMAFKGVTPSDFFDRYDSMKPEGQEFRADDIDTPRVRSYGATLEATAPNFLDFVTDPETLKKAGKVGLELAGGFPKKIFKAGKIAIEVGKKIKPDIKDPAERFDILESVPEEEEKETTEERTRGQINNLFDSPLGP